MKILTSILILYFLNLLTIKEPETENSWSILYSNPLFLRVISPNGRHLLADKFWLLSKNIDEFGIKDEVNLKKFFEVYKNIAILDSTFEIAIIYSSTYLASIEERGDLAIKLIKIAQILNPNNFQYLFIELIFQVVYMENHNLNELKKLTYKISKIDDSEKKIGRIDVTKWSNDIILYLQKNNIKSKIKAVDKIWLKSVKK